MSLNNKNILVTGGLGQVGIALLTYIQSHYPTATLYAIDLQLPSPPSHLSIPGVKYHAGNITSQPTIHAIFQEVKPQIVFHTAGLIPQIAARLNLDMEKNFINVNLEGSKIVLEESKGVGTVQAFVYLSSADVVKGYAWENLRGVDEGTPIPQVFDDWYAKSKVSGLISFFLLPPFVPLRIVGNFIKPVYHVFSHFHLKMYPHQLIKAGTSRIPHSPLLHALLPHNCNKTTRPVLAL